MPINRAKALLTGKKTITPGEVTKIVDLIKEIIAILSNKDIGEEEDEDVYEYEDTEEEEEDFE